METLRRGFKGGGEGMKNTWPDGYRHAIHQSEHEKWNATHYPGTRQLCDICGDPTGRCFEDTMWSNEGEPLCEECYEATKVHP